MPTTHTFDPETATRRLLVVDDHRDAADALAILLRMDGFEVETAYDGVQAVRLTASFEPDVVLLDIDLPKLDGYGAARQIRAGGSTVILIAVTGRGEERDRTHAREAGFDHHMTKPVDLNVLTSLLARCGVD